MKSEDEILRQDAWESQPMWPGRGIEKGHDQFPSFEASKNYGGEQEIQLLTSCFGTSKQSHGGIVGCDFEA